MVPTNMVSGTLTIPGHSLPGVSEAAALTQRSSEAVLHYNGETHPRLRFRHLGLPQGTRSTTSKSKNPASLCLLHQVRLQEERQDRT